MPPSRYRDRGWRAIPLIEKPILHRGWDEHRYKVGYFRSRNVGVVLGSRSNGLVDVDLDCPEALELADIYLPVTGVDPSSRFKAAVATGFITRPAPVHEGFQRPDHNRTQTW